MIAIADTHAAIWYLLNDERLSQAARTMFDAASEAGNPVGISSISIVEMIYLTEKQRIPLIALTKLQQEM